MSSADRYLKQHLENAVHPGTAFLCPADEVREREFENQERLTAYVDEYWSNNPGGDPFTLTALRRMHEITVAGIYPSAGSFRSARDHVDIPGASFVPSPGDEVVMHLTDLLKEINDRCEHPGTYEEFVEAAAKAFHRLLQIHPFLDGNGRVSRGLLHQMLHEFGLLQPPEQIYDYIEVHREEYYEVLRAADRGDLNPLVTLLDTGIKDWHLQRAFDEIKSHPQASYILSRLNRADKNFMDRWRRQHWFRPEDRKKQEERVRRRITKILEQQ